MENKNVGWLLIGVCAVLILIIFLFNRTTMESVRNSCFIQHGYLESCEMFDAVNNQTYLALAIAGVIFLIGLFLILSKQRERIVVRKVKEQIKLSEVDLSEFNPQEKQVFNMLRNQGAMFQADLIEKTKLGKAKITRIIDRLEGKGLVERKRRGMNNIVVIKNDVKIKQ